jgi:hypothetical protein
MSEFVIVIPDLYLPPDSAEIFGSAHVSDSVRDRSAAPGIQQIARFGRQRSLAGQGGWRPWLARCFGREDLSQVAPAVVALAASDPPDPRHPHATAWLATPIHRIAGLTRVHLDRRGLLQLPPDELGTLVADFNQVFGGGAAAELHLRRLHDSSLLLEGPASLVARTTEPARALVAGLEDSQPQGSQAAALKRLGAEVEMWLHAHPLNSQRARRGVPAVNALWFWGGGELAALPPVPASAARPGSGVNRLLGADPYAVGLALSSGIATGPLPADLRDAPGIASRECTAVVAEITPILHQNPNCSLLDAIAELDRAFVVPALAALRAGSIGRLTLLVNDHEFCMRPHDRLKFWRRHGSLLKV